MAARSRAGAAVGRLDQTRDAADAGARHHREPRGAGTGDSGAGADRRQARRGRHQGDPARRIGASRRNCCSPASASSSRDSCGPPIFRSRSRRSSASRPSRRAPPPTGRTISSRRRSPSRPRSSRRIGGRRKAMPSGCSSKNRPPARPRRPMCWARTAC